jgi:hypothetical protein
MENVRWVQASLDLLQTFVSHGGHRVIMAGTCAEYDPPLLIADIRRLREEVNWSAQTLRPLKNVKFCSRSRKTKILTTGIH